MRIGVDLGGTKIEVAALDDDGEMLVRRRIPTPVGSYPGTLAAVAALVQEVEAELGVRCSVGVGTPGVLSPDTGVIKNSNSSWLLGKALDADLAAALGRPVRLANDANCFALSEATDGAGAGAQVVFGVIVGTGTGGGAVIRGHLLTGANGIAGEWGHNPLPWPDPSEFPGTNCYCGRRGCIECYVSGPGLSRDYEQATGFRVAPPDIVGAAARGDGAAEAAMARYEDRLARGLAHVLNVLDPDVIVLGGGMSRVSRLYHNVPARWREFVFSDLVHTPLVPPVHGDSSGVRGAAWLWPAAAE